MNYKKDELLLCKRFKELAIIAENKGICTYSDFLNLNEMNIFLSLIKELPNIHYELYGGYEEAERRMICFYSKDSYDQPEFKIQCLKIRPRNQKFSDNLTHRDFLGAILNLGVDRSKIGDILVNENEGYLFVDSKISNFIVENLIRVKHTTIECSFTDSSEVHIKPNFKEITGTVSSLRLDAVLSVAFKTSRSSLINYIAAGKVFVNSKLIESNSYVLKENDVVSVRGMGKFIYKEMTNQTKKGRYYITLQKYV